MYPLRILLRLFVGFATAVAIGEQSSLEEQVVELCDSPYRMAYGTGIHTQARPGASEVHQRARQLAVTAIPICLTILRDRGKHAESRRAGAIGLLSMLIRKPTVSDATKAEVREAVLQALVEERPADAVDIPALGLEFLRSYGNEDDINLVIPFLEHPAPLVRDYAELTYTYILSRVNPDAPDRSIRSMMEKHRAEFRAEQASMLRKPPPINITSPSASSSPLRKRQVHPRKRRSPHLDQSDRH